MADKLYRSHSLEKSADGTSGSLTVWEDSPVSPFDVGDTFRPVTNGPALTVDKVSIKDSVVGELNGKPVRQWEITIEGSNSSGSGDDASLPETETVTTYEINGSTVRTVAGELIALRRSANPIIKKSISVYTDTVASVASPGSTYEGGTVTSENIVKETIKKNGVVTGSYYKHTLEVEA